ncbi:hypothetical protein D3C81_932490 [compost metagenome]
MDSDDLASLCMGVLDGNMDIARIAAVPVKPAAIHLRFDITESLLKISIRYLCSYSVRNGTPFYSCSVAPIRSK